MCKIIVYYEGKLFYKLLYINLAIQASLYICRKRALGCVSTEKFKTIPEAESEAESVLFCSDLFQSLRMNIAHVILILGIC